MKNHPNQYQELIRLMKDLGIEIPATMHGFNQLHQAACQEGALHTKTKELIALGIAITSRCDGCITFHVHDALKAGATKEEIAETIGVAILMGGGPALVYGCEVLVALRQFATTPETLVEPTNANN